MEVTKDLKNNFQSSTLIYKRGLEKDFPKVDTYV